MNTVYFDAQLTDDARRNGLYEGDLFVYGPKPAMLRLINHARQMIEGAFNGIDPQKAQYHMPVEKYVEVCAPLKPAFIHHPRRLTSTCRACAWSQATAT